MRIAGNAGGLEPTQFGGFSIATAGKALPASAGYEIVIGLRVGF
jgi:hypothetical protein